MAVHVFDEKGSRWSRSRESLSAPGRSSSMPIAFWNDPDGSISRCVFREVSRVWRHGDWCELTEHDGMIIYGRSDATLNPGGVRIGTAEIYRQVEQLPEIVESVAIGRKSEEARQAMFRSCLFVRLREGEDAR